MKWYFTKRQTLKLRFQSSVRPTLICASRLMLKQRPREPGSARKKHCRKGCNHSNVQGGRRMRRMSIKASSKLWSCWCNTQGAFRIKYNIWIRFERLPVIISKRLWIGFTRQSFMHSGWKSTPMLFSGRSLSQMYTLLWTDNERIVSVYTKTDFREINDTAGLNFIFKNTRTAV